MILHFTVVSFIIHHILADCGRFGATPLNKCTLISSSRIDDQPFAISHMYQCNNDIYTERTYSTRSNCEGDSTVANVTDFCTANPNYCSCNQTKCVTHTDIYTEDCLNIGGDFMYAAKDYAMNVCIGQIGGGSEIYSCPETEGGEPAHEEWDDAFCSCKDEEITANPKCSASHDYDVACDPHYFQYPMNECVQILRDPSLESIKYTCNETQEGKTSYFKHIFDNYNCGNDASKVTQLYECDHHSSSSCSCGVSTEECDSFLSYTYQDCESSDTTMERVMPDICVPSDMVDLSDNEEHDTWVKYSCNSDGFTTLDIYYDEACTKEEKECPLEYVYDCDYQMDGKSILSDDDKCGFLMDERAQTVPMDFCYKTNENEDLWRKAGCDGNGQFYIKTYTEYGCTEDKFVQLLNYTDACAEYAKSTVSCQCGKGAACDIATQAACDDPDDPISVFVLDECIFGNYGSMKYQCEEGEAASIEFYSDYQCTQSCDGSMSTTCVDATDANTTLCAHYRGKPLGLCMLSDSGSYDYTYAQNIFYKREYEKEDCTGNKTSAAMDECDPNARECFAPRDYKDGDATNCNVVKDEYCDGSIIAVRHNLTYTVTDICILQDGFANFPVKYSCDDGEVSKSYSACTNCVYSASHLISDPDLCVFSTTSSTTSTTTTTRSTDSSSTKTSDATKGAKQKSNTAVIVIPIVIAICVLALIAGFFFLNKRYNWIKAKEEEKDENYASLLDQKDNRL